jgi:hypothetical protein
MRVTNDWLLTTERISVLLSSKTTAATNPHLGRTLELV